MKKERREDSFIKKPYYLGGEKAMREFITANLRYPEQARQLMVEGDVHLRYEINHKGDVSDVRIIGGLDESCNEEAIRVIRLLKFEVPKNPRKLKITFHRTMRIHFRLGNTAMVSDKDDEESKPQAPQTSVITYQYSVVNSAPDGISEQQSGPKTYQYTITIGKPGNKD